MGVLNAIGEFGTGFGAGAQQGMNLYSQYQQLKDESEARNKKKQLEDKTIELVKSGKFKDDPIGFSSEVANMHLDIGDTDGWQKWDQYTTGLRNTQAQKFGLTAYALGKSNPVAAIPYINKMFKAYGNNNQLDFQKTPTGGRLVGMVDGQQIVTDYTDMEKLSHDLRAMSESYVMKPEDLGQLETEREKTAAYTERLKAETAHDQALEGSQIAENQAQARAADASAAHSGAATKIAQQLLPGQLEAQGAQLDLTKAQTYATEHPQSQSSNAIIDSLVDKAVDPVTGLPVDQGLGGNKMFLYGLSDELKKADPSMPEGTAAATAYKLSQIPAMELAKVDSAAMEEAAKTGKLKLPNGTIIPYSPPIASALADIMRSSVGKVP